jgi:hypothetical protein
MSGIAPVTKASQKEKTDQKPCKCSCGRRIADEVDEVFPAAASDVEFFLFSFSFFSSFFFFFFFLEKIRIDHNNRAAAGHRIKKDDTAKANPCP